MPSLSQPVFSENESHRTVSQLISETNSILQSVSCKEIPLHKSQVFAKRNIILQPAQCFKNEIPSHNQSVAFKKKFRRTVSQLFSKQIPSHIQSVVF